MTSPKKESHLSHICFSFRISHTDELCKIRLEQGIKELNRISYNQTVKPQCRIFRIIPTWRKKILNQSVLVYWSLLVPHSGQDGLLAGFRGVLVAFQIRDQLKTSLNQFRPPRTDIKKVNSIYITC